MKSSFASTPLTTGCPLWMLSRSPGPATIRLMKLVSDRSAVGSGQGSLGSRWTPHCCPFSAPAGGWKTTMSPMSGSLKW